jgi:hypothetical protein
MRSKIGAAGIGNLHPLSLRATGKRAGPVINQFMQRPSAVQLRRVNSTWRRVKASISGSGFNALARPQMCLGRRVLTARSFSQARPGTETNETLRVRRGKTPETAMV